MHLYRFIVFLFFKCPSSALFSLALILYSPKSPEAKELVFRQSSLIRLNVANNRLQDSVQSLLLCLRRYMPWAVTVDASRNFIFGEIDSDSVTATIGLGDERALPFEEGAPMVQLATLNLSSNLIESAPGDEWTSFSQLSASIIDVSNNRMRHGFGLPFNSPNADRACQFNVRGNPADPLYATSELTSIVLHQQLGARLLARYRWSIDADLSAPSPSVANLECALVQPASCPGSLFIDEVYLDFRHCVCASNFYWNASAKACMVCPDRLLCSPNTTLPIHRIPSGYFPVFSVADLPPAYQVALASATRCAVDGGEAVWLSSACVLDELVPRVLNSSRDDLGADVPLVFLTLAEQARLVLANALLLRCQYPAHCAGSGASSSASFFTPTSANLSQVVPSLPSYVFACSNGRDASSLLCSECLPFYYSTGIGNPCFECPLSYSSWVPAVDIVVLALVVFYFFRDPSPGHGSAGFSIMIAWLQLLSLLKQTGLTYMPATGQSRLSSFLRGVQSVANFNPFAGA